MVFFCIGCVIMGICGYILWILFLVLLCYNGTFWGLLFCDCLDSAWYMGGMFSVTGCMKHWCGGITGLINGLALTLFQAVFYVQLVFGTLCVIAGFTRTHCVA